MTTNTLYLRGLQIVKCAGTLIILLEIVTAVQAQT
jgi:hypothetical protein